MYSIVKYDSSYRSVWNDFVARSKNGTFLFNRGFMEYHADRFEDYSLIVFKGTKIIALLPAHINNNELYSHWGLTYGGLVLDFKVKLPGVIEIVRAILNCLNSFEVRKIHIKTIPSIYHIAPAQEFEYALFLCKAKLTRRDTLSVIENEYAIKIAANRLEGVKKGQLNNFKVEESTDYHFFWNDVLLPNLQHKHNAKPVHSIEEIIQLKNKFPDTIKLFVVKDEKGIAAGTVIFETDTVAHAQYISGNNDKGKTGSLDFLYYELITKIYKDKKYIDFGTSNEAQGKKLNYGLNFWKESYGARTIVQDFYEVDTANYTLLDNVLI
ncbi:GNAT family N-acetyltransferase [Flavobacterium rhizosphaerae]|uniref:GNAT family N-acetyltransferase n=1 Tax=Flavobacterium rhizosphaerae TaxID=3163298 RepID=A0ABW8Z1V2_9FLAO